MERALALQEPKVCIVTPIHDDRMATLRYLESIENLDYPNLDVVIVDDGSTDGSAEAIAERYPSVTVLPGDGSLWWTAATNIGAREGLDRGARFIFTCNNDVVLDPQAVTKSVACALEAGDALVGAVVFHQQDPEKVWFSGARFDAHTGDIEHDVDAPSLPKETQMLTGMGMLIPAEAFMALGGFDLEAFPHYLADCDLSLRASAAGYRLLVAPDSRIYNDVSSAWSVREYARGRLRLIPLMLFSKRSAYWVRGRIRFYRRHWGPGWAGALIRLYLTWFKSYPLRLVGRRVVAPFRRGRS